MSPRALPPPRKRPTRYSVNGCTTILNHRHDPPRDASEIALAALAWILADAARAQRFLDLTGLTPDGLRGAIGEPTTHQAVLDFLGAHEPDLLEASEALEVTPAELIAARDRLAR